MQNPKRNKLIELGADELADALLKLAAYSPEAEEVVEHLLSSPHEKTQKIKKQLSDLFHSSGYVDWREISHFSGTLKALLNEIASTDDPSAGLKMVATFYEADAATFERCDDSSGYIGDIFSFDAKGVFDHFASRCEDKNLVIDVLFNLYADNDYGARDTLSDKVINYLTEAEIRTLIEKLQERAKGSTKTYSINSDLIVVESLARQIKDPELFEATRRAAWSQLNENAFVDIACVYFEAGQIDKAVEWVEKVPENTVLSTYKRDKLLQDIYRAQGNEEQLIDMLYKKLRRYYSVDALQELIDIVGKDKRDDIIEQETAFIIEKQTLSTEDIEFLISVNKTDAAASILLEKATQIDGYCYISLPVIAEKMKDSGHYLVATLIYRALLESILDRGYSKAYPHGVGYLKMLNRLSVQVTDWNGFKSHSEFLGLIKQKHSRKRGFWSRYEQ